MEKILLQKIKQQFKNLEITNVCKEVLSLYIGLNDEYGKKSKAEIANLFNVSPVRVNQLLNRARRQIRNIIQKDYLYCDFKNICFIYAYLLGFFRGKI